MIDGRRQLGAQGEAHAASYLARRGYRIVGRNVRAGGVELDLVATRAGVLVFVEVKARRTRCRGAPAESVDARKRARIVRGATAWLRSWRGRRPRRVRFDVITCEPDGSGGLRLEHLEGAFDAGE